MHKYVKNWIKMMLTNSKAQSKYNLSIYIKKIKEKLLKLFYKKSGIQNFPGFRVRVWVSYPKKVGIPGSGMGSGADTRTRTRNPAFFRYYCMFFSSKILIFVFLKAKETLKKKFGCI